MSARLILTGNLRWLVRTIGRLLALGRQPKRTGRRRAWLWRRVFTGPLTTTQVSSRRPMANAAAPYSRQVQTRLAQANTAATANTMVGRTVMAVRPRPLNQLHQPALAWSKSQLRCLQNTAPGGSVTIQHWREDSVLNSCRGANRFSFLSSSINRCPQAPINCPAFIQNPFRVAGSSAVATNGGNLETNAFRPAIHRVRQSP